MSGLKVKLECEGRQRGFHSPSYCIRPESKSQIQTRSEGTKPWRQGECRDSVGTPTDPLLLHSTPNS